LTQPWHLTQLGAKAHHKATSFMTKHIYAICALTLLLAVYVDTARGQNQKRIAYYDALELSRYVREGAFDTTDTEAVTSILKAYLPAQATQGDGDCFTAQQVFQCLNQRGSPYFNPFLLPFIESGTVAAISSELIPDTAEGTLLSAVGGLNVTRLADGLARFLVVRTKHELSISFFRKFKDELDEFEDVRILFQETHLRNHDSFLDENPTVRAILESSLILISDLGKGKHPANILNNADLVRASAAIDPNIKGSLEVFNLFSRSLRSKDSGRYWVSVDSLRHLKGNALKIYFGLIYQQMPEALTFRVGAADTIRLKRDVLGPIADSLQRMEEVSAYVEGFIDRAALVDRYVEEVKATPNPAYEDYFYYFDATLDLLEYTLAVAESPLLSSYNIPAREGRRFVNQARTVGDIFIDVRRKNYNSAIFSTTILLDSLLADRFTYRAQLLKYGAFMAAVAEADNSEQVQEAIEAVALPPGSASVKRRTKSNIALNAYVGLAFGGERFNKSLDFAPAVNAPVGVAFSWGRYKWKKSEKRYRERGAFTIFASLIDIGALTAFRFGDDETEALPEVNLKNIFAPGLSFVYGMPNSPFSIGVGGQLGPALREVTADAIEKRNSVNWRFHFSVSVDIPLLNLHTVSR